MSRFRGIARWRLAVVAALFTLALVAALELTLAAFLARPQRAAGSSFLLERLRRVYAREDWSILQGDPAASRYDPELLYLLRPGTIRFSNREYSTTLEVNQEGLRDDAESLDGPDLIVLGDSYALGWGVEQEESFPQVLERRSGLVVLNAAMPSYGTGRELALLERLDTSRARAVVVQYFLNDYAENRAFSAADSPPAAMRESEFDRWQAQLARRQRYRPLDYLRAALRPARFHPELEEAAAAEIARACLELLARSEALAELPVFFLQIDPWTEPDHNLRAALVEVLESEETFGDLARRLTPIDPGETLGVDDFFILDPHLRPSGHEKIAILLERELGRAGLQEPPGRAEKPR